MYVSTRAHAVPSAVHARMLVPGRHADADGAGICMCVCMCMCMCTCVYVYVSPYLAGMQRPTVPSGYRVQGTGYRVQGTHIPGRDAEADRAARVQGTGCMVHGTNIPGRDAEADRAAGGAVAKDLYRPAGLHL